MTGEVTMFMFLPFLLGLLAALCMLTGRQKPALAFSLLLAVVTLAWLQYHATDPLQLSF
jgi:hypothetical protein